MNLNPKDYRIEKSIQQGQVVYTHKYGLMTTDRPLTPLQVEMHCFKTGRTSENGGMGKYLHFRNVAQMLLPDRVWHEWSEDRFRRLCDDDYAIKIGNTVQRHVTWAGAAAAGKTFDAAFWCVLWWMVAPHESIACLTSTTAAMVRKRIWQPIQTLFHTLSKHGNVGHLVDSKTMLQCSRGDDKHAIFAKAVGGGETTAAAGDIQGMHAPRILIVLDEAAEVKEAIPLAMENMIKGCADFTAIYIGNPKSRTDVLGRNMEPKDGWNSVNVDTEEWRTKKGVCQRFDGFKSPNVKAKKTIFPFLFTWEDYQFALKSDEQNTVAFWMFTRGFPPPDGVVNSVISEAMIETKGARGKHTFISQKRVIAALDPAFGGDKCILRLADFGDVRTDDGGSMLGITLTKRFEIECDATDKRPKETQIAEKVIRILDEHNVGLDAFGMDGTGTGRGIHAAMYHWSTDILVVEFGGAPSELPASESDPRPCNEVYDRKVTELWFSEARFVESTQLNGFDDQLIRELCARQYVIKSKKLSVETKEDYKARVGHSPDDADAVAVLVQVARKLGATPAAKSASRNSSNWLKVARKFDSVNTDETEEQPHRELFDWV